MKSILTNPARMIQLVIGAIAFIAGWFYHDYLMVFLGGWIIALSVLNRTCCGSSYCGNQPEKNTINNEETTYTEIK